MYLENKDLGELDFDRDFANQHESVFKNYVIECLNFLVKSEKDKQGQKESDNMESEQDEKSN